METTNVQNTLNKNHQILRNTNITEILDTGYWKKKYNAQSESNDLLVST